MSPGYSAKREIISEGMGSSMTIVSFLLLHSDTNLWLTLMQPTMVVVSAELYCVQSTVEYINTKLQNKNVSILIKDHNLCLTMKLHYSTQLMWHLRQGG